MMTRALAAFRRRGKQVMALRWRLRLAGFGAGSVLERPRKIHGGRRITIGQRSRIYRGCRLEVVRETGAILIGSNCNIEHNVHIGAALELRVGDHCVLGSFVTILDHDHGLPSGLTTVLAEPLVAAEVRLGRGVWVGEKATILKGVAIGDGAVVGANAVVTKDVPRGGIAVGVPAHVVAMRNVESGS